MSTVPSPPDPTEPIETPFADAASPFKRTTTNMPAPVFVPPSRPVAITQSYWVTYRSQINFGLALVAFLMMLVGAAIVIEANPGAEWTKFVAAAPSLPGAIVLYLFVRGLMSLDEIQVRIQLYALGLSLGATALATFAYGFFEGVGLPDLPPATVLPLMAVCWGLATAYFTWRYRRS